MEQKDYVKKRTIKKNNDIYILSASQLLNAIIPGRKPIQTAKKTQTIETQFRNHKI